MVKLELKRSQSLPKPWKEPWPGCKSWMTIASWGDGQSLDHLYDSASHWLYSCPWARSLVTNSLLIVATISCLLLWSPSQVFVPAVNTNLWILGFFYRCVHCRARHSCLQSWLLASLPDSAFNSRCWPFAVSVSALCLHSCPFLTLAFPEPFTGLSSLHPLG